MQEMLLFPYTLRPVKYTATVKWANLHIRLVFLSYPVLWQCTTLHKLLLIVTLIETQVYTYNVGTTGWTCANLLEVWICTNQCFKTRSTRASTTLNTWKFHFSLTPQLAIEHLVVYFFQLTIKVQRFCLQHFLLHCRYSKLVRQYGCIRSLVECRQLLVDDCQKHWPYLIKSSLPSRRHCCGMWK